MHYSQTARKIVTLFMLVLTLNVVMTGFAPKGASYESSRADISHIECSNQSTDNAPDGLADFKPPKSSFVDYAAFFSATAMLPAYLPLIAFMGIHNAFQLLPSICSEIPVPPIIASVTA